MFALSGTYLLRLFTVEGARSVSDVISVTVTDILGSLIAWNTISLATNDNDNGGTNAFEEYAKRTNPGVYDLPEKLE